jgi:hypothetical protein
MKVSPRLEGHRLSGSSGQPNGIYRIMGPCGAELAIIVDDGVGTGALDGWEHVSVSTQRRIPNWLEMCFVKDLFWNEDDWVVQFHPAKSQYVNNHPNVLHLWRPTEGNFPTPPSLLVGVKELGELA